MTRLLLRQSCVLTLGLTFGCVPKDPPGGTIEPQDPQLDPQPLARFRPRPHARSVATGQAQPSAQTANTAPRVQDPLLSRQFVDDFEREQLGSSFLSTSARWTLRKGWLCGELSHNHPVWLKYRLPTNVRISVTARSESDDGDIKLEAWGSGTSFAQGTTYSDATSYLFVFGGWKNQLHVLARLNEHASDRLALRVDPTQGALPRAPVEKNRAYRWVIERKDGHTIDWSVDGVPLFRFDDPNPLKGEGHDHFGFNNWETRTCFDDLVITPLSG